MTQVVQQVASRHLLHSYCTASHKLCSRWRPDTCCTPTALQATSCAAGGVQTPAALLLHCKPQVVQQVASRHLLHSYCTASHKLCSRWRPDTCCTPTALQATSCAAGGVQTPAALLLHCKPQVVQQVASRHLLHSYCTASHKLCSRWRPDTCCTPTALQATSCAAGGVQTPAALLLHCKPQV